nr:extracellular solute-binding protein [Clostridiales bacterium]
MKKTLSAALCAFILASFIACGQQTDGAPISTSAPDDPGETTGEAAETEPELKSTLPDDLDFGNREVPVIHFGWNSATLYDAEGDNTGDVIRDAVYNRNLLTEERLKVKFAWSSGSDDWGGYPDQLHKMILAADCPYNMFMLESSQCFRLSLQGDFQEITDLPYVDLEQPWWYTRFMNRGSITPDHKFFLTGAFSVTTLEGASCAVVNKTMFDSYFGDYNELYDMVEAGGWTYDKFTEYCAAVYKDLNGNSEKDMEDQFGFINEGQRTINYLSMSTGLEYITRDENGLPQMDLYNDKTIKWVDTLYNLIYNDYYSFSPKGGEGAPDHFVDGRTLFYTGMLSYYTSEKLRSMEIPKGVVPHPVLEEGLEYVSAAGTVNGESVVIPVTT